MKHATWILVVGLVLAGVAVGTVVIVRNTPSSVLFSATPPSSFYDEFEDDTKIEVEYPAYRSDGSWTAQKASVLFSGKSWDGNLPMVFLNRGTGDIDDIDTSAKPNAIILFPSGQRIEIDYATHLTLTLEWSEAKAVAESFPVRVRWGTIEYELHKDSVNQIRSLLSEIEQMKAN